MEMTSKRRASGYRVVRMVLGLLLLTAGLLKVHQLGTEPVAGKSVLTWRPSSTGRLEVVHFGWVFLH